MAARRTVAALNVHLTGKADSHSPSSFGETTLWVRYEAPERREESTLDITAALERKVKKRADSKIQLENLV